jgi:hypothetical protein
LPPPGRAAPGFRFLEDLPQRDDRVFLITHEGSSPTVL